MADYEVGNLQIKFSALDEIDFKKISQGLNSVKRAIIGITNIDSGRLDTFSAILSDLSTKFLPFLQGVEAASGGLAAFNGILRQVGGRNVNAAVLQFEKLKNAERDTGEEAQQLNANISNATESIVRETKNTANQTAELALEQQKAALEANEHAIALLKAQYAMGQYGGIQKQYEQELKELENEQRRLRGETEKTTKGWKKFLNQVKRIAIYRLIRTALRAIVSTFRDTINAFAEVDDNVNDTMSQITTSLQFIKLGFGSTILPLLQMIAPIVEQIGYAFADMGNMISASMSKDGKFTKINTKAWKDYREQIEKTNGALLDFDKFRVLNQQQGNLSDFLLPNQSVEEYFDENGINETAQRIKNIVYDLSTVLSDLFDLIGRVGTPIIKTILAFAEPVIWFVSGVIDLVTKFIDKLDELGILEPIIEIVTIGLIAWGSTKVIGAITKLATKLGTLKGGFLAVGIAIAGAFAIFDSWADMSTWQRVIGIIGVATTAILGLAVAFGAFHSAWSLGLAAAGIVAGIAMIVGAVSSAKSEIGKSVSIPQMAQGGLPDRGTLFYAGEAGAEMVYNMPSGQSGVANVTQIEQAFYNALIRYGRENNGGAINVNVNLDGQQLYRSVEREAGKRGLGFARK